MYVFMYIFRDRGCMYIGCRATDKTNIQERISFPCCKLSSVLNEINVF